MTKCVLKNVTNSLTSYSIPSGYIILSKLLNIIFKVSTETLKFFYIATQSYYVFHFFSLRHNPS